MELFYIGNASLLLPSNCCSWLRTCLHRSFSPPHLRLSSAFYQWQQQLHTFLRLEHVSCLQVFEFAYRKCRTAAARRSLRCVYVRVPVSVSGFVR